MAMMVARSCPGRIDHINVGEDDFALRKLVSLIFEVADYDLDSRCPHGWGGGWRTHAGRLKIVRLDRGWVEFVALRVEWLASSSLWRRPATRLALLQL
jgi:hypothetical protein